MQGYAGFVLIGSSKGVRFAVPGGNANLTIGALIETDEAVRCFEGQGPHVWFGWSNFETTHYGLGGSPRSLLQRRARPAYAADIMNPGPGVITSVVTFQDRRVFTADIGGGFGAVLSEEIGVLEATGRSTPAASTTASPMTSCPCSST